MGEAALAEITLGDLLVWEPRLRLAAPAVPGRDSAAAADVDLSAALATSVTAAAARDVSWAVALRATPPLLPPLRGSELVLLPHRLLQESGVGLGPLLRDLAGHDVAAVVMEAETVPPGLRASAPLPILVLSVGPLTPDLEGEVNRLLTQHRGELYRAGTDFGRLLAGLTTADADAARIVATTADALAVPVEVVDGDGRRLAAARLPTGLPDRLAGGGSDERHAVPLIGGEVLWLGPLPADRRALARLVGERVGMAVEAALARAARVRPRGPARANALAAFLAGGAEDGPEQAARAAALGLAPAVPYRVALGAPDLGAGDLQRLLAPLGVVHDAATIDGLPAALLDPRGEPPRTDSVAVGRGSGRDPAGPLPAVAVWLAVSGPAPGIDGLRQALREARFVAALLDRGQIGGPLARFDRVADLGVFRLLYAHWGRGDLEPFAAAALGDLPGRDRRGVLRQTLLAFFESGGSHVEAAARLAIHRNTLAYRLKQIAASTKHDPSDPANRLLLHLALLAAALPPAPE